MLKYIPVLPMDYGIGPLKDTPAYSLIDALVGISRNKKRSVKHGHFVLAGPEGRMEKYAIPLERCDVPHISCSDILSLSEFLSDYEPQDGALYFSEDGRLKGTGLVVDADLKAGCDSGVRTLYEGYGISAYDMEGRKVGPKFIYACALTSCDPEITAITHSGAGAVTVVKNGRPVWIHENENMRSYRWNETATGSYVPYESRGQAEPDDKSTALAQELYERIIKMDYFRPTAFSHFLGFPRRADYVKAEKNFPYGMLAIIGSPEIGREYCMPINGNSIFSPWVDIADKGLESCIEKAAHIEGAMFVNALHKAMTSTNQALNSRFPRPPEGTGLREYLGLPEGADMKMLHAASLVRETPAAAVVVRTPRLHEPFRIYVMANGGIIAEKIMPPAFSRSPSIYYAPMHQW